LNSFSAAKVDASSTDHGGAAPAAGQRAAAIERRHALLALFKGERADGRRTHEDRKEEHTEEHADGRTRTSGSNTNMEQHGTPLDTTPPETATDREELNFNHDIGLRVEPQPEHHLVR
jgi:hypothetical protein